MPLLHIRLLRPFLLLLLLIAIPSIGWSQCSPFAYNPITGRLDCAPASSGMTDPTTTTGDLLYRSAALPAAIARLAIGTNGQYLGVVAGVPAWTTTNLVLLNASNTFTNIAPVITAAESWIGPSSTTGIYFKGGNVGIGTTSPAAKLDIQGAVNLLQQTTPTNPAVLNNKLYTKSDDNVYLLTSGGVEKRVNRSIANTTSALKGDGTGDAVAVTGTATDCVKVDGSSGACGSGGATAAAQLTDFQVVKTSGTVETINGACSASAPCNIQYGTTVYSFTSAGTVTISGTSNTGSVYWWLDSTGALNAGHNTTTTLTGSGVTISTGITAFPADTKPLWVTTFTANVWDAIAGSMDKRAFASTPPTLTAGANITLTKTGTGTTIASTASGNPLQGYIGQATGVTLVGTGDNTVETVTTTSALGNPGCWTIDWRTQHTTGVATLRYSLKIGSTTTVWNTSGDTSLWQGRAIFCATGTNAEQLDIDAGVYNLDTGGAISFFKPTTLHATPTESTSTVLAVSIMAADTGGVGGQVVTPVYLKVSQ